MREEKGCLYPERNFLSCDMRDIKIMKDYFIENLNNLPSDADYKSKLEVRTHEGIPTSLHSRHR